MTEAFPECSSPSIPLPANETERLAALHRYKVLDTPPEAAFDRITSLAARLFKMPIVLVSLVDESRAWFKSCIGFDASEVSRNATLCSFTMLTNEPLIVPDARLDDRFACNPFVQSEPGVRFYAGAPLLRHDGFNLGTLCLLDNQPRASFTPEQQATLVDLAAMVVDELELRLAAHQIAQINTALRESEELKQRILESSNDCIKVLNLEGKILYNRRRHSLKLSYCLQLLKGLLALQQYRNGLIFSWVFVVAKSIGQSWLNSACIYYTLLASVTNESWKDLFYQ